MPSKKIKKNFVKKTLNIWNLFINSFLKSTSSWNLFFLTITSLTTGSITVYWPTSFFLQLQSNLFLFHIHIQMKSMKASSIYKTTGAILSINFSTLYQCILHKLNQLTFNILNRLVNLLPWTKTYHSLFSGKFSKYVSIKKQTVQTMIRRHRSAR
jgi:hypothetical protein